MKYKTLLYTTITSYTLLGCYRGNQIYDKYYVNRNIYRVYNIYFGGFLYINPVFLPLTVLYNKFII